MFGLSSYFIFGFVAFAIAIDPEMIEETTTEADLADTLCNCDDQCHKVIGLRQKSNDDKLLEEDSDEDGDRMICARNRDTDDKTFPSICHMMCHNRCTKFRVWKMIQDGAEISYVAAYRDNFYKLHNGAC